jgi:hypothetical protein
MSAADLVTVDLPGRNVRTRFTAEALTWFLGRNGSGKTTSIMAALTAAGHAHDQLRSEREGRVTGFGVTVEIGRKLSREGEPTVEVLDPGAFSRLVQPASEKRETRNAQRLRALFAFRSLTYSVETLLTLAAGDEDVAALVQSSAEWKDGEDWRNLDLLALAERVRNAGNRLGLGKEMEASAASGAVQALRGRSDELAYNGDLGTESSASLATRLERQRDAVARMRAEAAARRSLEEQKAAIDLGARPNLESAELDEAVTLDAVGQLERQLSEARARHGEAKRTTLRVRADLEHWKKRKEILDRPVAGATAADVLAGEAELQELSSKLDAVRAQEEWDGLQDEIAQARGKAAGAAQKAEWYRSVVGSIPAALSTVLTEQGIAGVTVVDGELATEEGKPVEELSLGNIVKWAHGVALPAYENASAPILLYLPEKPVSAWHALDTAGKLDLVETCRRLGIRLLVETASHGDLKVVHEVMEGLRHLAEGAEG